MTRDIKLMIKNLRIDIRLLSLLPYINLIFIGSSNTVHKEQNLTEAKAKIINLRF